MHIVRYRHRSKSLLNINKYRCSLKTQLLMRIKKKKDQNLNQAKQANKAKDLKQEEKMCQMCSDLISVANPSVPRHRVLSSNG